MFVTKIFRLSRMRGSIFAADNRFWKTKIVASDLADPHDTNLGSANTFLELNYLWRRLLPDLLMRLYDETLYTGTEEEIETAIGNVDKLIEGLYASATGSMSATFLEASRTTTQSLSNGDTAIIWNSGDYDVSNPTRLIIPFDGIFIVSGNAEFSAGSSQRMDVKIVVNGSTIAISRVSAGNNRAHSMARSIELSANDYLEMIVTTNSASVSLDLSQLNPTLSVVGLE